MKNGSKRMKGRTEEKDEEEEKEGKERMEDG